MSSSSDSTALVIAVMAIVPLSSASLGCSEASSGETTDTTALEDANPGPADAEAASESVATGPVDIEDKILSSADPSCAAYTGDYFAEVVDVARGMPFTGEVSISSDGTTCTLSSNSIPNHDFNASGAFATRVAEVTQTHSITAAPVMARAPTELSLEVDNAFMLNGVKLDRLAAACYGVGPDPLGRERIGCFQMGRPWRYDPMFPANDFGTDEHNAHTQPDGAYHYHGDPRAMYDDSGRAASGVIGFAADGFPIFGPWIDDGGTVRRAVSGYTLKEGARVSQPGEGAFPGGNYDGTFVDDYAFTGRGDLDECNGMTVNGSYGYYVTDSFPWVIGCFRGTPDPSFNKR